MDQKERKKYPMPDEIETLSTLIAKYPQWKDLPIVVISNGQYDWIGKSGVVFEDATGDQSVLVFAGN